MKLHDDRDYVTIKEAARILSVHVNTVRALVREGKLDVLRIGRAIRIQRMELQKLRYRRDDELRR